MLILKCVIYSSSKGAWRMIRSYTHSDQRLKEWHGNRTTELSACVPFLCKKLGTSYMVKKAMVISNPYFVGTAMWKLFHILAAHIAATEQFGQQVFTALLDQFRTFFLHFQYMHPCPTCREHLLHKVSVNDTASTPDVSEAKAYPLSWLYLAGDQLDKATLQGRLETIQSGDHLMLFVWETSQCCLIINQLGDSRQFRCHRGRMLDRSK